MVAVIKFSSSLRNVLNYNENKLKQKKAELIHSSGYGKDTDKLGFTDKWRRLEKQMQLNDVSKKSVVHISLNFDPSEKLNHEQLGQIASEYMHKIGFGKQPYLVYQHHDAGHPHIHIVSTTIRNDGSRIKTHNIGRNQSEIARKEIELLFGLVKADHHKQREVFELKPVNAQRIQYGRSETKRAITNVLDAVLKDYNYTSLAELNAILKQYNVIADRGTENSRVYKNNGLVYRVLDDGGNKIGVPIKASDLYQNTGLKFLEERYVHNAGIRQPFKLRIKNAIDLAFVRHRIETMSDFQKALQKEKIQLIIRRNDKGIIYGLTYLDQLKKCVLNGSDLGKQYSGNAIQQRCNPTREAIIKQPTAGASQNVDEKHTTTPQNVFPFEKQKNIQVSGLVQPDQSANAKDILDELTKPENGTDAIPYQLKQKRRRRKKRLRL